MEGKARPGWGWGSLADALTWSGWAVACTAAAITLAASRVMQIPADPAVLGLALSGTLCVYTLDRLRDLDRDRATSPRRSAFIAARSKGLRTQCGLAGAGALAMGMLAGPAVVALAAGVAALGLFHRRLKGLWLLKAVYVSAAWTAVTVGMPALRDPTAQHVAWVGGIVAGTVGSNVILSNLRDREAGAARLGPARTLNLAALNLLAPIALASLGPAGIRPLIWLPLLTGAALVGFRPTERYGALAVDGALLVAALLASIRFG